MEARFTTIDARFDTLESRLSTLEKLVWGILLTIAITVATTLILKIIG